MSNERISLLYTKAGSCQVRAFQ